MNYFSGLLKSLVLDLELCQERGFEFMWLMLNKANCQMQASHFLCTSAPSISKA